MLFFTIGVFIKFFSDWFISFYGEITPEQFLFNLKSPLKGTSSDMVKEIINTPIFSSLMCIVIFFIFVSFNYDIFIKIKNTNKKILSKKYLTIATFIISCVSLVGGSVHGVEKLHLKEVYKSYVSDSSYIQDNYADPRSVNMSFPHKKRNLIHIYLESVENSFLLKI